MCTQHIYLSIGVGDSCTTTAYRAVTDDALGSGRTLPVIIELHVAGAGAHHACILIGREK